MRTRTSFGLDDIRPPDLTVEKTAMEARSATPTILVVDDERLIADTISEILVQHGFAAFKAYSGEEGLRLSQALRPEIVLSDVLMPRMSGIDMAILIKEALPATRIVLFSGQATTAELLRKAAAAGHTFELLAKPIHPDELVHKIKEMR
ncbi:MAG: response regulator [Acidobacteriaceae bacterium]